MIQNQLLLIGPELPQITQLKEDFEKNKLEVEINTANDFDTAHSILMANSPMVVISTDILLILKLLMKEKDFIKKKSTKTILFNAKGKLPFEVEHKLNINGLSGELTDQSTTKTVYYKATLFLKSLPSREEVDDILYDGTSSYDPDAIKKKISYIKDVKKGEDGEVEFETSKGIVESVVLDEFCTESNSVLEKMEKIIEGIEDKELAFEELNKFGEYVSGIMGTASVLGLEGISTFCQLTKSIADHIMLYEQQDLRDIVVGVLGDSTSFLTSLMDEIRQGDESTLKNIGKEGFIQRLHWLADKFKITDEKAEVEEGKQKMSQASIDDLLASLNA